MEEACEMITVRSVLSYLRPLHQSGAVRQSPADLSDTFVVCLSYVQGPKQPVDKIHH